MSSLFLRLIQPIPFKDLHEINADDLSDIKSQSLKHNLLMLVYTQLHKYKDLISSQKIVNTFLEELKALYLKSVTLSLQQEAVEKEIFSILNNRMIQAIVIRGNTIAKEIYGDPNCRTSVDIDILIRREEAVQVDSFLSEAGYVGDSEIPLIYWLSRIHHATYYQPQNHIYIEIHWNFGVPYFFELTSEEIWKEVILTDADERKLSPEMILIMLLIHHHTHSFRELKILVDILWAFHKYEDVIDWNLFAQKLRGIGLLKATLITLSQINDLWKESVQEMRSVLILQQEIERMGYKVPGFLLSYFQIDSNKKYHSEIYKDKLIARLALDKWSTIIFSYFNTLFPVPEAIKELYSTKSNWALPYNYLRFIKWRVREWTGKNS